MSSLRKLSRLLALLSSQRRVPREQICEELGISVRSVYRYIGRLSEANIPVYFDAETGGYRLNQESQLAGLNLSDTEVAVAVIGLLHMCERLPEPYHDAMRDAAIKLCGQHGLSVEDIDSIIATSDSRQIDGEELACQITNGLVLYAIAVEQPVQIDVRSDRDRTPARYLIERPGLRFDRCWCLVDQDGAESAAIPLTDIATACLIRR